mmetsp:Transcript_50643/g.123476  ORF Transcript_50643/g.123476 Transcript_50643/m.123476 type:complete len:284 (-) Transcript_50643:336-1187(-)
MRASGAAAKTSAAASFHATPCHAEAGFPLPAVDPSDVGACKRSSLRWRSSLSSSLCFSFSMSSSRCCAAAASTSISLRHCSISCACHDTLLACASRSLCASCRIRPASCSACSMIPLTCPSTSLSSLGLSSNSSLWSSSISSSLLRSASCASLKRARSACASVDLGDSMRSDCPMSLFALASCSSSSLIFFSEPRARSLASSAFLSSPCSASPRRSTSARRCSTCCSVCVSRARCSRRSSHRSSMRYRPSSASWLSFWVSAGYLRAVYASVRSLRAVSVCFSC